MQQRAMMKTLDCPDSQGGGTHQLAYHEWQGPVLPKTTIVGVHGLTRNSRDFDFFAEACTADYRVICPDIVGRGKSAWLKDKSAYHYGTYVADMIYFLETLQLKDIYWVGTSMGGLIGMVLAAMYPEYIKKLVMNDIGPFIPQAAVQRLGEYVGKEVTFQVPGEAERYIRSILAPWGALERSHWRHIAEHSFRQSGGKYVLNYDPDIRQAFFSVQGDIDMWELWAQVKCPVLVLRGATSDLLTSATADRMRQSRPGVDVIEFAEVGHAPALMQPDQITKVKDWLARP